MLMKKILPLSIKRELKKLSIIIETLTCFYVDAKTYLKYSNLLFTNDTEEKLLPSLIRQCHVIEKGLTMPDRRLGFGKERIINIAKDCSLFAKKFDESHPQFINCLKVLAEYKQLHEENNYNLDDSLQNALNNALGLVDDIKVGSQIHSTKNMYFSNAGSDFENFSNSRHSIRHFEGTIDIELIKKAVKLAQNSPSSCNRQPARVYLLQDKEIIKKISHIQNGNRGFGHLADKLLIVASELGGYILFRERNSVYIDGGMYAMNLLYSLHYYKIGACALNASFTNSEEQEIRQLLFIPKSQKLILIIACGDIPNNIQIASSLRTISDSIMKII